MAFIIGKKFVFGQQDISSMPWANLPSDATKVKIKMRNKEFAQAYVKTPSAIYQYYIVIENGKLLLENMIGSNHRKAV